MLGAIIGDIAGSWYEFNNIKSKDFIMFTDNSQVTDDSLMTLPVAKAIMEAEKIKGTSAAGNEYDDDHLTNVSKMAVRYMCQIGRKYPEGGYGGMFIKWIFENNPQPYNSFGNGAAMRISPVGFAARTEREAVRLSEAVTGVTHNHPEGIKGAESVAVAIFMARRGSTKDEIRQRIHTRYYPLDFTIDEIRPGYRFNETCQGSVPQAIEAFLESSSFEDAIRTAISLGGDSDTLGAITGSMAEAYYGVPEVLKATAMTYLDNNLRAIIADWKVFMASREA